MMECVVLVKPISEHFDVNTFQPKLAGDVGCDLPILVPNEDGVTLEPYGYSDIPSGVRIKISDGFWGEIRPRSSSFVRHRLMVMQGTIDPGYTGEIYVTVFNPNPWAVYIPNHSRLAQLVLHVAVRPVVSQVEEMPNTERGTRGFGSTGA